MRRAFSSITPARVRLTLNLIGVLILLTGLASAAVIWRAQDRADKESGQTSANPAEPLSTSDSRKQSREVEIYYGKTGLLMERWSERVQGLAHGKPLAKMIVVVSSTMAVGCFFVAVRLRP
jgi:hypothetical protein